MRLALPHRFGINLSLNDALDVLASDEAELAKLRIFADFSVEEAGKLLYMSRATAYPHWTYRRAWLKTQLAKYSTSGENELKTVVR